MLEALTIRNFGIIENISLDFSDNLNILTGETGAGKSILIDALRETTIGYREIPAARLVVVISMPCGRGRGKIRRETWGGGWVDLAGSESRAGWWRGAGLLEPVKTRDR